MPKLWPVLSQAFTAVFTRLGIQAVPAGPQWFLSDTIVPVSLVDSDITLQATVTTPIQIRSSAGRQAVPGAGTVLADTGPLAAGSYRLVIFTSIIDGNFNEFQLQHRDAGNAANIVEDTVQHVANDGLTFKYEMTQTLALNERFRVLNLSAAAAGSRLQATIYHNLL